VSKRRKRRKWSGDEKRMICAQTRLPGISVSPVARRYDVNANQVFNWLTDAKFAAGPEDEDVAQFLPIEVVEPVTSALIADVELGEMAIELSGGHRLRIIGAYDPEALATLIRKLFA